VGVHHPCIAPPTCRAYPIAILLHDYCAIYDPPPTPLLYAIHHTILVMAMSCKGPPTNHPPRRQQPARHGSPYSYSHTDTDTETLSVCVLCGSPVWPSPPVMGPLWGPPLCVGPLFGSPVWVPVWVPSVWVPCVGPLCGSPVWVPRPVALRHASTRVMSPARSHAPA